MGLARSFGELGALRLLLGLGEAISPLASMAFIKQNFKESEQGLPTSLYVAGLTLGPAIGALAGASLLDEFGWRHMFVVTGLAGCIWLFPWLMLVPARRPDEVVHAYVQGPTPSLGAFLRTPVAWGLAGSVFFYSYYWYFFLSWVPTYLVLKHGMPNLKMGMIMAAPLAGMAAVNLCSGTIADLLIRRRGNSILVRKRFVYVGFFLASALMALAWVEKGGPVLPILLTSLMGVGIGAGNYWALSQSAVQAELIGRALGFQNMIAQAAGAAAPLVTGLLLGPEQDFRMAILVAGGCPIISVVLLLLLVRTTKTFKREESRIVLQRSR
jgi:MFS family permease